MGFGISPVAPIAPALGFADIQRDESAPSIQDHLLQENGDDILLENGDYLLLET